MENIILKNILAFLGFFAAGLAVNLTPCVYPMLTVTISIFRHKEGKIDTTLHSFLKAGVYVMGIAVMYSSLGLFAALSGSLFGGILQNQWVVLGIALMLFVLALDMFEVYQLRAPAWLTSKLGGVHKVNYFGLFVSGMCVGVFAAPCIGPPVIALLTIVAEKGDPYFGFWAFFIFSMGMGLPYLILGTYSKLLKKLPKSGAWMTWVEHCFGVILLGFCAFYLAIGLKSEWLEYVFPATLIFGSLYLGFVDKSGSKSIGFMRARWAIGLVGMCVGATIIYNSVTLKDTKLVWQEFTPVKLVMAQGKNKPVVIDFTADWCITCHELENYVFSHPDVIKELRRFTLLRVDATDFVAPDTQELLSKYELLGLPAVIFYNSKGEELKEARVTTYVPPEQFLKSIDKAKQ